VNGTSSVVVIYKEFRKRVRCDRETTEFHQNAMPTIVIYVYETHRPYKSVNLDGIYYQYYARYLNIEHM